MNIIKRYQISSPRNEVFNAWISEQALVDPVIKIQSVPEVGGHYILYAGMGDSVLVMNGRFLEFKTNQKLTYTWNWNHDSEKTTVMVEFIDDQEGTRIDLRHDGFLSEDSKNLHDQGWDAYVAGLSAYLKNV